MAISVAVPKDLSKIKTKVALNLTKRQIICFGAGALFAIPVFFLSKKVLGMETSLVVCMASCVPFFIMGLYERNGMPAEKHLYFMLRHNLIRPCIRAKSNDTKFDEEERMKKVREEIKELERKGKEKKH